MYLSQCSQWDSYSHQEVSLVSHFSWVLGILFCTSEMDAEMTNPLTITASEEEIILSFPTFWQFMQWNSCFLGFFFFFSILPHNQSLHQDLCLRSLSNLVVSSSLHGCTMKHKYSYSLDDFLVN